MRGRAWVACARGAAVPGARSFGAPQWRGPVSPGSPEMERAKRVCAPDGRSCRRECRAGQGRAARESKVEKGWRGVRGVARTGPARGVKAPRALVQARTVNLRSHRSGPVRRAASPLAASVTLRQQKPRREGARTDASPKPPRPRGAHAFGKHRQKLESERSCAPNSRARQGPLRGEHQVSGDQGFVWGVRLRGGVRLRSRGWAWTGLLGSAEAVALKQWCDFGPVA